MAKIRVCHITTVHKEDDIRIFKKECRSLSDEYEVYLIASNCNDKVEDKVTILGIKSPGNRLFRMLRAPYNAYKKAKSLRARIYHIHDSELLPYGLLLKRGGAKVIYDIHEDVPRQIMSKHYISKWIRRPLSKIVEIIENFVSRKLNHLITATPHIKERFHQINTSCSVVGNFPLIEEIVERSDWDQKKNEICYIGGITKIRGISSLVESLELVDDVRLNLAGTPSPASYLEELKGLKGWSKVNYHGQVNRQKAMEIMDVSMAGMVTFLSEPNHIHAIPNKFFEYLSSAIPIIVSDFQMWRSLLQEKSCALFVNPEDPEKIAEAVSELVLNRDRSEQMGLMGLKAVKEEFNWNIEQKKLLNIYQDLL